MTTTMMATWATNARLELPPTASYYSVAGLSWPSATPEKQTVEDRSRSAVTAANTAAKPLDNACPGGRLWNVGPAHGPQRTVLDDVPTPTDLKGRLLLRLG